MKITEHLLNTVEKKELEGALESYYHTYLLDENISMNMREMDDAMMKYYNENDICFDEHHPKHEHFNSFYLGYLCGINHGNQSVVDKLSELK